MEDYNELKQRYFRALHANGISKGDIRAFIGVKTSLYENYLGISDPYENHITAFCKAISDLEPLLDNSKRAFNQLLQNVLSEWRQTDIVLEKPPVNRPLITPPIKNIRRWHPNGMSMVSLFSGAFGLDLGFLAAGFNLKFATDIDNLSFETAKANLPDTSFVLRDFDDVRCEEILEIANLQVGEIDVLVGGPPCQPFSTAGKRRGFNDPRSSPLRGFVRSIKELQPRIYVMEEVSGLASSRLLHVPISERGNRPLLPEEVAGSAFREVINLLNSTGYRMIFGKLNSADYGSPQIRERLIFIGLRDGEPTLPEPTHSGISNLGLFKNSLEPWNTLWEATADLAVNHEEYVSYSKTIGKYMAIVPPGGHWRQLPTGVIPEAMGGAYQSGGGKMGFFRRLSWDEPTPTLVTTPLQKGTIFGHPDLFRPLGINEYKRVQGFPDDWFLPGTVRDKYKLIGNAVSVHFSYALANHVLNLIGG